MASARRIAAVDVFRGAAIAFMVVVNNPGDFHGMYALLRHSEWHGWTPVDFVFPFFLFIVGVSMSLSLSRGKARGVTTRDAMLRALRRGAILFLLGLVDNGFPFYDLGSLRIPGVLQRIGIVTIMATPLALKGTSKAIFLTLLAMLLVYWPLMTAVPVPAMGSPDLSQPTANVGAWLDRSLLGGHLWVHEDEWDPEGILSTIPALCITLMGVLAGRRLMTDDGGRDPLTLAGLTGCGGLALVAGMVWDSWFPINRWLWTSSFMLLAGGTALMLLAACLWLTDYRGLGFSVLKVYGSNAIVAYLASSLLSKTLYFIHMPDTESLHGELYKHLFAPWLSPPNASLAWSLACAALIYALVHVLYVRKIFLKV